MLITLDGLDRRVTAVETKCEKLDQDGKALSAVLLETRDLAKKTAKRLKKLERRMDERFELVDRRLDAMDQRFDAMDQRFDGLSRVVRAIAAHLQVPDLVGDE